MRVTARCLASCLALLLAACGLAACGAQDAGPSSLEESDDWMDGIPGTYVMDVGRNTARTVKDADGVEREISEEVIARVQASSTDTLEMKADGTFELRMAQFHTAGTWRETADGLIIRTTMVNGEAAADEVQVEETYGLERGCLYTSAGGKRIYFKKIEPE